MEIKNSYSTRVLTILRIAAFMVFAGRAYQHLFWDIPIRSLLWDQELMEGIITRITGMTWQEYTTSATVDSIMNSGKQVVGVVYVILAILTLIIRPHQKRLGKSMLVGSTLLFLLALLYFKAKFFYWGQLIEYTAQVSAPIFLYLILFTQIGSKQLLLWLKLAISLTFIGHGLYAVGFYPVPGHFVTMLYSITGWNEDTIFILLKIAGYIDFVIGIAIFLPWKPIVQGLLIYATLWGFLTAMARVVSPMFFDIPLINVLHEHFYETIYRMPHVLLPLSALMLTGFSFSGAFATKRGKHFAR